MGMGTTRRNKHIAAALAVAWALGSKYGNGYDDSRFYVTYDPDRLKDDNVRIKSAEEKRLRRMERNKRLMEKQN